MILRIFKSINNDVYRVTFVGDPTTLSSSDKDLMESYGEPEINVGGDYGSDPDDFTLPNKFARVVTDFPFTMEFDSRDVAFTSNIETKVASYISSIKSKFTSEFITLRSNSDVFTGEELYTV